MNDIVKKRLKAIVIDSTIAYGVTLAAEPLLKKKIKNEFFHATVTQTLVFWGLEFAQLQLNGQTVGQKMQGIRIESEDGSELTSAQIVKRLLHRDFISPTSYLLSRKKYHAYEGAVFPHDVYASTVVKKAI